MDGGYGGSPPENFDNIYLTKVGLKAVNNSFFTCVFQTVHPVNCFILIQMIGQIGQTRVELEVTTVKSMHRYSTHHQES